QTQCTRETNEAFPRTPGRAEQAPRSEKLLGGVIGNRGDFTNRSFTHSRLSFTHTLFFLPLSITVARKFSIFSEAGVVLIRSGNGKIRDGVPRGFLLADLIPQDYGCGYEVEPNSVRAARAVSLQPFVGMARDKRPRRLVVFNGFGSACPKTSRASGGSR